MPPRAPNVKERRSPSCPPGQRARYILTKIEGIAMPTLRTDDGVGLYYEEAGLQEMHGFGRGGGFKGDRVGPI